MTIGPRRIAAIVGAIGVVAALAVGYQVGGATGVVVLVGLLQIALVVAVLETRVSLSRQGDRRASEAARAIRDIDGRVSQTTRSVENLERDFGRDLEENRRRVVDSIDDFRQHVDRQIRDVRKQITAHTRATLNDQYRQIEALLALYHDCQPKEAFPPLRTWVASPDLLHYVYRRVIENRPSGTLELGSGVSTLVIAYALRRVGQGQLISLEHDQHFLEDTARQLERHELEQWVDLRLAPLEPVEIGEERYEWYSTKALPTSPVDLVLVDGPPGGTQPKARYPALPMTRPVLAKNAVVILDDYDRDDEQLVVAAWLKEYPDFTSRRVAHEKGTAVLEAEDQGTRI